MKNINFVHVVRRQCNNEVFIFYLHVLLGYLLVKLLGVNLTPLASDDAFFIST